MVNSLAMEEEKENRNYNTEDYSQERGLLGSVIGGLALGPVGAVVGDKIQDKVTEDDKEKEDEQQKPFKFPIKRKTGNPLWLRHWMCCPDSAVSIFWNQQ